MSHLSLDQLGIEHLIVMDWDKYSYDGLWSGTEGRQRQAYIAVVPTSRYKKPPEQFRHEENPRSQ